VADLHSVEMQAVLSEQRLLTDKLQLQIAALEKELARLQQTVLCGPRRESSKPTESSDVNWPSDTHPWELGGSLLIEADRPATPHCSPARSSKRKSDGSAGVQTALLGRALSPCRSDWQDVQNTRRPSARSSGLQ